MSNCEYYFRQRKLTFLITLDSHRGFQNSVGDTLGSTILAPLRLVLCYVVMSMMFTLVLTEPYRPDIDITT